MDRTTLLEELKSIVSAGETRPAALAKVAALIKESGNHRWVGLYDVNHAAGLVSNIVWSGPGAPEFLTFPITKGLTGSAISMRKTVNVGNVASDPRYLTAFGTTQSEIIVPIFDPVRPEPATGFAVALTSSGSHVVAHAPVHGVVFFASV